MDLHLRVVVCCFSLKMGKTEACLNTARKQPVRGKGEATDPGERGRRFRVGCKDCLWAKRWRCFFA